MNSGDQRNKSAETMNSKSTEIKDIEEIAHQAFSSKATN